MKASTLSVKEVLTHALWKKLLGLEAIIITNIEETKEAFLISLEMKHNAHTRP